MLDATFDTAPQADPEPVLDLDFVRGHFPALHPEDPNLAGWALFDNAGGSLPPRSVIERLCRFLETVPVQLGATYPHSAAAGAQVAAGRRAIERLTGAGKGEIVLGASTTANANLLARALVPGWRRGDEIVVTNLDHEANNGAWRRLEAQGLLIREWRLHPETALLRLEDLEPLLSDRTRLVCFTHCSNVVGAIHDVAAITRRVHEAGARVCVDGVAYAPHRRLDLPALGVDFYLFSLYKTYGPHQAVLYGRREHLLAAARQNHFFFEDEDLPAKLEPGGSGYELTASLTGILDYFEALHRHHFSGQEEDPEGAWLDRVFALITRHEAALAQRLLQYLRTRPEIRLLGPTTADPALRVPTISFTVEGRKSSEIPPLLERQRLAVRYGHFYALRAMRALGLEKQDGVVRVSLVHYNTLEEVDRLVAALEAVL